MPNSLKPLPTYPNHWKTIESKPVYQTPWIKVTDHKIIDPGGNPGQYGVVTFKNLAVGVIPLDQENNTWIVGQFRYPLNEYSWEIPEGGGALQLPPIDSAKRELLEETGITAKDWELILEMDLSNSASTEKAFIYVARDLNFQTAEPDENEDLQILKIPFDELYKRVVSGEIRDSLTVAGVLRLKLMLNDNQ
ncbi:MAG: DNA mismatch repair protein MutT [Crocinitomicaceae bacterium]|nr:DNA mismatch repair protein MutT [Crocinitomicaceae bacterium]|tara:strand:+ start:823 stop:1398 length:576 start_codon:yes stop_codon:yes gene_type:complete